jgi:hypothetical protein
VVLRPDVIIKVVSQFDIAEVVTQKRFVS